MTFLYSFLGVLGLLCYIIAGLAIFRILCTFGDKYNRFGLKIDILALFILIVCSVGGFIIRDYSEKQKHIIHFEEMLSKNTSNSNFENSSLSYAFKDLDTKTKEEIIGSIFYKKYSNTLLSKCKFIYDYREEDLGYIKVMRRNVQNEITSLYDKSEKNNDWNTLKNEISVEYFLKTASKEVIDREFNKWSTDDGAWERVKLLDSLYLSKEYLNRYPNGKFECDAKRIILDNEYNTRKNVKKISHYTGYSTFRIENNSSYNVEFYYHGDFQEGKVVVSGNSTQSVKVPNGYYRISIYSEKLHTSGIHEVVTCDNSYHPYNLNLRQR